VPGRAIRALDSGEQNDRVHPDGRFSRIEPIEAEATSLVLVQN